MTTLSICLIVRDEATNLARCLASVEPLGAELAVVDTGSTDETVAIAERFGARVGHFPWRDDFAAAVNHAFDQATGEWILRLDADEELVPEALPELRRLLEDRSALAYLVRLEEVEDGPGPRVEMLQPRLFRNRPEMRLVGRIHEHFPDLPALEQASGLKVLPSGVHLRHYGHRREHLPAKLERAARLLELELRERPGQLYYQVELGRTWLALRDPRGAELLDSLLPGLLAVGDQPNPPSVMAAPLLEYGLRRGGPDLDRLVPLVERWFPHSPPLLARLAAHWFQSGEFARALPYYERLVRLSEQGDYDRSVPFSGELLADGPLLYRAVCLHRLARFSEAARAYRALLARYPGHPSGVANLEVLRGQSGRPRRRRG